MAADVKVLVAQGSWREHLTTYSWGSQDRPEPGVPSCARGSGHRCNCPWFCPGSDLCPRDAAMPWGVGSSWVTSVLNKVCCLSSFIWGSWAQVAGSAVSSLPFPRAMCMRTTPWPLFPFLRHQVHPEPGSLFGRLGTWHTCVPHRHLGGAALEPNAWPASGDNILSVLCPSAHPGHQWAPLPACRGTRVQPPDLLFDAFLGPVPYLATACEFFSVLEFELRASCLLGRGLPLDPQPQIPKMFLKFSLMSSYSQTSCGTLSAKFKETSNS
jgi:hypothetical protein